MQLDKDAVNRYMRSGAILKQSLKTAEKVVRAGASYMEIAEKIESTVKASGGELAFPVNISCNNVAAHDTADVADKRVLREDDVVKIDVGVHTDGYIADGAITIDLSGKFKDMVLVCKDALKEALKLFVPGTSIEEISRGVEEMISSSGYKPVVNLTGHKLERYLLHGGVTVPNVAVKSNYVLKEGDVFAVEPFVTNGSGKVVEGGDAKIFAYLKDARVRNIQARRILEFGKKRHGLPFALRWICEKKTPTLQLAINELLNLKALHDYHVLKDVEGSVVVQTEHSVIVAEKPIVYTE